MQLLRRDWNCRNTRNTETEREAYGGGGGRTFLQDLQGAAHPLFHDTSSLAVESRIA